MRKPGRPKLAPELRQDEQIFVGVSPALKQHLHMVAREQGVPLSKLLRQIIVEKVGWNGQ